MGDMQGNVGIISLRKRLKKRDCGKVLLCYTCGGEGEFRGNLCFLCLGTGEAPEKSRETLDNFPAEKL